MIEAKALEFLSAQAQEAVKPFKVEEASDDRQAVYFVHDGTMAVPVPKPPRDHAVKELRDLVKLANRFAQKPDPEADEPGPQASPIVWHDEDEVVLVLDDDGHRVETATLSLIYSDVFVRVIALRARKDWLNQKDFIRLLRVELAGTMDDSILLNKVREIRFEQGVSGASTVRHSGESMGRSINEAVNSQAGAIPEEVVLNCRVYKSAGEYDRFGLRAAVEIDHAAGTFRLVPLPDEIERVGQAAVAALRERLEADLDESIPAFYGRP